MANALPPPARISMAPAVAQDMEDYVILGACNPPLAHQALEADRTIGLLLPCNVVVRADGDHTVVQALDPQTMVALSGFDALRPVVDEATRRLDAALASLTGTLAEGGRRCGMSHSAEGSSAAGRSTLIR